MANVTGTFSASGSSDEIGISDSGLLILGDSASSNFGGGTITLQVKAANGNWADSANTYTAGDVDKLDFGQPVIVRVTLSGATSPSLYYEIRE